MPPTLRTTTFLLATALLGLVPVPSAVAQQSTTTTTQSADPARQTLPPGDGWASVGAGTTGGSAAGRVVQVRTAAEFRAAVGGDEPKIVQVVGRLDANTTDNGRPISCAEYNVAPYTLENYLRTYDPAQWTGPASGPMEDARKASSAKQAERVRVNIGANTTVIGLSDAQLVGFTINIESVDNVIVRNLRISDAYDCFPGWNGETWKTEWDNVVVSRSTHVWLDHLTLDDGETVDTEQPKYFGEPFLRHDGLLDVVRQADLVTISWNKLKGHDKSLLWGNGDGVVADRGKLRVTMHHNELTDLVQRAPRVRFGQAHVYNNLYRVTDPGRYEYSWGVGVESSIIARSNWFEGVSPDRIIHDWGGTGITESGNWVNRRPTAVLEAYNAVHPDDQLLPTVSGSSGPHLRIDPAPSVPALVGAWAGAGRLDQEKQLLHLMNAPATTTADGPVWSAKATGMASIPTTELPNGTTGGLGGRIVVADTAEKLTQYAGSAEPLVIVVRGSLRIPFGTQIPVASHKTIIGAGTVAELVGGGLFLNGTHNVIVRNLRIRDSYVPGDWDGKSAENDNDGIRLDTAHHVWIDHVTFERLGDGLVDVRKDSDYVTLSWNVFSAHNKTVGVGWTPNVVTKITLHHNWFSNTYQRNASIDNVEAAHVYNNWFRGFGQYGTMSRGAAKVVAESNYYSDGEDPVVAKDPASQIVNKNNVFNGTRGRRDNVGTAFDPATYYSSTPDAASKIPELIGKYAGPTTKPRTYGHTVTVALDGTGDFGSIGAAVATVGGQGTPVTIIVKPGIYREVVRIWAFQDNLTLRGATGNPADVVLTYDLAAGQQKFYGGTFGHTGSATLGILGDDVTVENLTVENGWDEQANFPSQAIALRTAGDRIRLDNVRVLGNQDTLLLDTPSREAIVRTWITDSLIQGDVDFIYGRGTAVITDSTIKSVNRGQAVNGYVTAAATVDTNPHGYLIEHSRFESDAAAGTVFLGRPWHPSGDPGADPRVVVRDSWLGAHIGTPAWTDMSGWSWRDARFAEYRNTGPGAATGDGRPQLTPEEAAAANRSAWLAGSDGWNPVDRD
ncbi:pectinesterase family protein [Kribbella sp. NPDC023972]|uniref:pectinesterase family protein n=1 Tax=Kribbella sp. NPDC023972 TaxID=3154795 RepID=UPI0033DF92EF